MTTTADDLLLPASAQARSNRQRLFMRYFTAVVTMLVAEEGIVRCYRRLA